MSQFVKYVERVYSRNAHKTRNIFTTPQQFHKQGTVTTGTNNNNNRNDITWDNARAFNEIPTENPFKLISHFLPGGKYQNKGFTELVLALKEDYGDVFLMPAMMGRSAILFTHNPDDFETVFRNEGVWPMRPGTEVMKYHRNVHRYDVFQGVEGVLTSSDAKWGSFRSLVNPVLMQPKNVRFYLDKVSQVNWEFVELIKEIRDPHTLEVPDDFLDEINRWTLESVSIVALDKQLGILSGDRNNPDAKELFEKFNEFITLSVQLEIEPSLWKIIKTPKFRRYMKTLDDIQMITHKYINKTLERVERENKSKPEHEKSILEKLVAIDKKVAVVMAMDLLMAGVDTTTTMFTGLMLSLAKNPQKQAKLREEIMKVLPQKDSEFTEESVKNLPYLRACIKESLRMYPLALGNARLPQKDVVLSGYQVPKGTFVTMVNTTLLCDEQHYPRANEYLPERWLRAENATNTECPMNQLKPSNPFIYLPFGYGPRSCIGRRLAEMEVELGVARLIRNFQIEFNHSTENAFKGLLINVPNIPLRFKFIDIAK